MADLDDIKDGKDFGIGTPQQNVPFTLKGCGSLDWGMQSRLSRIFNPKSNRTVMLAFDHGYFQGRPPVLSVSISLSRRCSPKPMC